MVYRRLWGEIQQLILESNPPLWHMGAKTIKKNPVTSDFKSFSGMLTCLPAQAFAKASPSNCRTGVNAAMTSISFHLDVCCWGFSWETSFPRPSFSHFWQPHSYPTETWSQSFQRTTSSGAQNKHFMELLFPHSVMPPAQVTSTSPPLHQHNWDTISDSKWTIFSHLILTIDTWNLEYSWYIN